MLDCVDNHSLTKPGRVSNMVGWVTWHRDGIEWERQALRGLDVGTRTSSEDRGNQEKCREVGQ